jgi:hypothetical protein
MAPVKLDHCQNQTRSLKIGQYCCRFGVAADRRRHNAGVRRERPCSLLSGPGGIRRRVEIVLQRFPPSCGRRSGLHPSMRRHARVPDARRFTQVVSEVGKLNPQRPRSSTTRRCRIRSSILGQDVQFTKLLLNLHDARGAPRPLALRLIGYGRPAISARYDRDRNCCCAIVKRPQPF